MKNNRRLLSTMSKKTNLKTSLLIILALLFTTIVPLKTTALEHPSINLIWLCDLSESDNEDALQGAYSQFTERFDNIASKNSEVIVIRDDNERFPVRPWSDNMTFDFGGQANVVGAFQRAKERVLATLSESEEQIQLVVFSDLCQSVAVSMAREQTRNITHADRTSIENAQRFLDEDLSELEPFFDSRRLKIHVVQWECRDCAGVSYSPLVLPEWVSTHNVDLRQPSEIYEAIGEIYASILNENSFEWQVRVNAANGTLLITRNSGLSVSAVSSNTEITARLNRDISEGEFTARLYYWRENEEAQSIQLDWNGNAFTGQQLDTEPLNAGNYFWEFRLTDEHTQTSTSITGAFSVENLAPVSVRNGEQTLRELLSSIDVSGSKVVINLDDYHSDPDGDELWYTVSIVGDESGYLRLSLSGERNEILTLTGLREGTVQIEIVARDRENVDDPFVQMYSGTYAVNLRGNRAIFAWVIALIVVLAVVAVVVLIIVKCKKKHEK
jgi:hypothetical protein